MKERPIPFNAPMVRAIRAGTKTQTRRVMKRQPSEHYWRCLPGYELKQYRMVTIDGCAAVKFSHSIPQNHEWDDATSWVRCPYGQPGDLLWVRETWRVGAWLHRDIGGRLPDAIAADYRADNHARREWLPCRDRDQFTRLVQQSVADAKKAGVKPYRHDEYNWEHGKGPTRWRPSIHMPRWASRILLEITAVRVERLQAISDADALAEGIVPAGDGNGFQLADTTHYSASPVDSYISMWEAINGPGSVEENPWVWVIEFKRVQS